MEDIVVQKYGGSSVATPERIRKVAERVARVKKAGHAVAVVVSAMGDSTDDLLALADATSKVHPPREMDVLLSTGEQVSASLLAMALTELGVPAVSLTGWQAGVMTDLSHRRARIRHVRAARLRDLLWNGQVAVVTGFQGLGPGDEITTLGRGGSDMSAVALAKGLGARHCEICSDVAGVFTADPRRVPEARPLKRVAYEEMLELSSLGAQVLQYEAVELAWLQGVRIWARSTFDEEAPGTWIEERGPEMPLREVTGLVGNRQRVRLGVVGVPDRPGVAHEVFKPLAENGVVVDMIVQSITRGTHTDIAFTVPRDQLELAYQVTCREAERLGAERVDVDAGVAQVSAVGAGMATRPGVAAKMFGALSEAGINIQLITTSEIKISCLVAEEDMDRALLVLHRSFGLGDEDLDIG